MHQQDGSSFFLHIGLKHCVEPLQIISSEKWTPPLSYGLCHIIAFPLSQEPFFLPSMVPLVAVWNTWKH